MGHLTGRSRAPGSYSIVVRVPKADRTVFRCRDELVGDSFGEPAAQHWLSVVLAEEHLREVVVTHAVNVASVSCHKTLETVWAYTESIDCSEDLSLNDLGGILSIYVEENNLAVTTSNSDGRG